MLLSHHCSQYLRRRFHLPHKKKREERNVPARHKLPVKVGALIEHPHHHNHAPRNTEDTGVVEWNLLGEDARLSFQLNVYIPGRSCD